MNSRKISDSQKIISVIITIITIVVFFFGIIFLVDFITDYSYDKRLPYKKSTLEYQVDFPVRLAEEIREDRMHDPDNRGLKEYYALGQYIDSEMQIGINEAIGEKELVSYYTERAEQAKNDCGSLESYAEEYSAKFDPEND